MNTNPTKLASELRAYLATMREKHAALAAERTTLLADREALFAAPVNVDDAKQFIFDYIDARGAEYPALAQWPKLFSSVAYPPRNSDSSNKGTPLCLRDIDACVNGTSGEQSAVLGLFGALNFFGAASQLNRSADTAAYFFFGDTIKAKVAKHFAVCFPGYTPADAARIGPPIAERRTAIAKIDMRLTAIKAEIDVIDAQMREVASEASTADRPSADARQAAEARARDEQRDKQIYHDFNGRNAEEIAKRYSVAVSHVTAVANRRHVVSPN